MNSFADILKAIVFVIIGFAVFGAVSLLGAILVPFVAFIMLVFIVYVIIDIAKEETG